MVLLGENAGLSLSRQLDDVLLEQQAVALDAEPGVLQEHQIKQPPLEVRVDLVEDLLARGGNELVEKAVDPGLDLQELGEVEVGVELLEEGQGDLEGLVDALDVRLVDLDQLQLERAQHFRGGDGQH